MFGISPLPPSTFKSLTKAPIDINTDTLTTGNRRRTRVLNTIRTTKKRLIRVYYIYNLYV